MPDWGGLISDIVGPLVGGGGDLISNIGDVASNVASDVATDVPGFGGALLPNVATDVGPLAGAAAGAAPAASSLFAAPPLAAAAAPADTSWLTGTPDSGSQPDWLSKALGIGGDVLKKAVPLAGAGAGVSSVIQGINQASQLRQAQQFERQTARPAAGAGQALTQAGQTAALGGPLPPQLQGMIDQWKSGARSQMDSFLARSGISDSTMKGQFDAWINQRADQMHMDFANAMLSSGYQGITTALGPSTALGSQAQSVMSSINNILAGASRSLSSLLGSTA